MPLKYCKSSEKVCPAGPPGLPGPTGAKGQRGRRGQKGKKGPQGPMGLPGKSGPRGEKGDKGEAGSKGTLGSRGEKGNNGNPGPQGMPGTRGEKGNNGNPGPKGTPGTRGEKGNNGNPGPKGMPGARGEKGNNGNPGTNGMPGTRGEKGDKGEPGSKGMPGRPGSPGKSASAPEVILSPAQQTRGVGGNMAFYCTVRGNPPPTVEWRFKGKKVLPGAKYSIKVEEFIVKNLNFRDDGQYTCHAKNILGSSEATGSLSVRGKSCLVMIIDACKGRGLNHLTSYRFYSSRFFNFFVCVLLLFVGFVSFFVLLSTSTINMPLKLILNK